MNLPEQTKSLLERRKLLEQEFYKLDKRDEVVSDLHFSQNRENNELTLFGIIARKTGGRWFYSQDIAERDRLLLIKLVKESESNSFTAIEYPYRDPDLEAMWECMFNVWVKASKKAKYAQRFMDLINKKLRQSNLFEEIVK